MAPSISPSPSLSPTSSTKSYNTPHTSATVAPLVNCSIFDPKQGLATVTINLTEKNGQKLSGPWTANMNSAKACPAIFPGGISFWPNYIPDGDYSWTSVGFSPGKIRIDVNYHSTGQAFDIDATSGNHIINMTVSN